MRNIQAAELSRLVLIESTQAPHLDEQLLYARCDPVRILAGKAAEDAADQPMIEREKLEPHQRGNGQAGCGEVCDGYVKRPSRVLR